MRWSFLLINRAKSGFATAQLSSYLSSLLNATSRTPTLKRIVVRYVMTFSDLILPNVLSRALVLFCPDHEDIALASKIAESSPYLVQTLINIGVSSRVFNRTVCRFLPNLMVGTNARWASNFIRRATIYVMCASQIGRSRTKIPMIFDVLLSILKSGVPELVDQISESSGMFASTGRCTAVSLLKPSTRVNKTLMDTITNQKFTIETLKSMLVSDMEEEAKPKVKAPSTGGGGGRTLWNNL